MQKELSNLNGRRKCAILLVALGVEASSRVFKYLDDMEVEELTKEIINLKEVSASERATVIEEFYQMMLAQEYILDGGVKYAKAVLEQALGSKRALEIINKVHAALKVKGFNVLKDIESNQLLNFIVREHPQTIALVLSQVEPSQAAFIISDLPEKLQSEVIYRIANMEHVAPELLKQVEHVLESRIDFTLMGQKIGGLKAAAEILNMVGQSIEKNVLKTISEKNPEMAEEIKKLMFVFEDILLLGDRAVQRVLREIDSKDLSLALKATSEDVKAKIFKNMSERAAAMVKEELEFMGPVKLKDVEEAQQKIVDTIRKLEEEGEIVIGGGRGEEIIE